MKALDIIEYLADKNNEPQRMCDIAEALEMNISTVTSVFGAPIVIFMLVKRQKNR